MSESNESTKDGGTASNRAPTSGFLGYKKIDFEVFWNRADRISIRQGNDVVSVHPGAMGYLYGMIKDVRDEMEARGFEWRDVD